jgi:hypothetical protein
MMYIIGSINLSIYVSYVEAFMINIILVHN